jgi:hypothetical protein
MIIQSHKNPGERWAGARLHWAWAQKASQHLRAGEIFGQCSLFEPPPLRHLHNAVFANVIGRRDT